MLVLAMQFSRNEGRRRKRPARAASMEAWAQEPALRCLEGEHTKVLPHNGTEIRHIESRASQEN
jgi:hypothetical protein